MKDKFTITIDLTSRSMKPSDVEANEIRKNVQVITAITISDISKILVQPYAYTWSPGIFNGYRSNSTWIHQQSFALDFDSGIEPDVVKLRFKEFDLIPNMIYYTFSDTPEKRRFRVLIFVDTVVNDHKTRSFIQEGLLKLFPEADHSCKDASRIFYGGKTSEIWNEGTVSFIKLLECIAINNITRDHNNTRSLAENRVFLYNYYNNKRNNTLGGNGGDEPDIPNYLLKLNRNIFDFDACAERVRIFKEFLNGKWLTHLELFGLATNLHWINGGLKKMKETMNKYNRIGITKYTPNNFNILKYIKGMEYLPQQLCHFSPYAEDYVHRNLIKAVNDIRGHIEIIKEQNLISLEEGKFLLQKKFDDFMNNEQVKIYIIKVPTAIGKTELLTKLKTNVTIALPTHDLIEEVSDRMKIDHIKTPRIPTFQDKSIKKKIEYLYSIGLYNKVFQFLKVVAEDMSFKFHCKSDVESAVKYLKDLSESNESDKTILTTHQRSLLTTFSHDTIIYDEDPLDSLIEINKLKISDLYEVEDPIKNRTDISILIQYLLNSSTGVIFKTPRFDIDLTSLINEISRSSVSSNILAFFQSEFFIRDKRNSNIVHYVSKKDFKNKKIIIMSASVPIDIYKKLYGNNVEVFNLTNIEQRGQVIQHTDRSCSRVGLKKYKDKILKKTNDMPTITYKKYSSRFNTDKLNIHFGNCEGYDFLKGQDISVVGTPNFNNIVYLLYASVLGIQFNTMDSIMSYQQVEWNRFRFKFQCYDNVELRKIAFSLIEAELIQAVGRARTLITDATVTVYSNFPLYLSSKFIF
jgi:hypothetical protein